jgi:hypothetical protein
MLPLLKHRVPLATLVKVMWQTPRERLQSERAHRIPVLVPRLYQGARDGKNGFCLERSLLTYRFLSGAGANPQLVIGIRGRGGSGSVIGHAWVVVDGEPLFEPRASLGEYTSFFSFGKDGTLQRSMPDRSASETATG